MYKPTAFLSFLYYTACIKTSKTRQVLCDTRALSSDTCHNPLTEVFHILNVFKINKFEC